MDIFVMQLMINIVPFCAMTLLVSNRKSIQPVKILLQSESSQKFSFGGLWGTQP